MALVVAVVVLAVLGIASAVLVGVGDDGGPSGSSSPSSSLAAAPPALPSSMASAGDSITRAFDVSGNAVLRDSPEESWSTGSDPAVDSQYVRILAAQPAVSGHQFNDAVSGAMMAALDGQLQLAAAQRVEFVTVLMGANDLCARTPAAMTPTATFAAQFDRALSGFFAADPGAHVFVSSIPDLFRLWDTLRNTPGAQIVWSLAHICQSMLSTTGTPADRQQVVDREQADNTALASVCRRYPQCRFDGGAVYRATFTVADISPVDSFHPSLSGQAKLAATTWAAGYWPSLP